MNNDKYKQWATYRRKILDNLLEKHKYLYKGTILDIGGRDRGRFIKPKQQVDKWIFADINNKYNPEIILDVSNMMQIGSNSIDVVNAIELFEHVKEIEKGLEECYRVLKEGGVLIISSPFLYHIHGDPYDYQRWTHHKWRIELNKVGFNVEKLIIMGKYFTSLAEMVRFGLKAKRSKSRYYNLVIRLLYPILEKLVFKDNGSFVRTDPVLNNWHSGYFIVARK